PIWSKDRRHPASVEGRRFAVLWLNIHPQPGLACVAAGARPCHRRRHIGNERRSKRQNIFRRSARARLLTVGTSLERIGDESLTQIWSKDRRHPASVEGRRFAVLWLNIHPQPGLACVAAGARPCHRRRHIGNERRSKRQNIFRRSARARLLTVGTSLERIGDESLT